MTRRIAIVGIDGSGKSTIVSRLRSGFPETPVMTAPDFHTTSNAPLADLSVQFRELGVAADRVGDARMKAVALYLHMTLFGPVEKFFQDTFEPATLICERHPLIDTLVYAPFYVKLSQAGQVEDVESKISELLEQASPGALADIERWQAGEESRLGRNRAIWEMLDEIVDLVAMDTVSIIETLSRRFRTTMPDAVLWLDLPPGEAAERCGVRSAEAGSEIHETQEFLSVLQAQYAATQKVFATEYPEIPFHRIDTSNGITIDASVDECARVGLIGQ